MKTSEAQRKAVKKWKAKNKEKTIYMVKKSTAKNFILKTGNKEDLLELQTYLTQRLQEMQ